VPCISLLKPSKTHFHFHLCSTERYKDYILYDNNNEPYTLLVPRPCLFERIRIWGRRFVGTEALFAFFPAFPCLYLGIETLFAFFVRPGHFSVGWKSGKSALPTDRVCMRTSLICPGRTILSRSQGRGTSSCLLEPSPCPFEL